MPLLKNGELYKLTEEDKKRIRNAVGKKFPAKFKMVPELFKPDPVNKGRIIRPPGVNIVTKSVVFTEEEGAVTWVYGRTFKKDKNNKMTSSDGMITFETELSVGANQMDWLFFLLFCCPNLKGSPHATPNTRTTFMLENIEAESLAIVEKEKNESAAIWFISHEWPEQKVRKVGAAMQVAHAMDADLIGIAQLRAILISAVKKDSGLKMFMEITNAGEEMDIRAKIQELSDLNFINYSDPSWLYLSFNEAESKYEISSKICDTIPGKSPLDSLIYVLTTDKAKWEQFKSYEGIASASPKTRSKKSE